MKKWIATILLIGFAVITLEAYLMTKWFEGDELQKAYVVEKDIQAGKKLTLEDLKLVYMKDPEFGTDLLTDPSAYLGKVVEVDLPKGKILTLADLEPSPERTGEESSLVVKLNPEQAHLADFRSGETVDLLCYNQGKLISVEDLVLEDIQMPLESQTTGDYYATLKGNEEALKTIYLSKIEGNITLVKKLTSD